MGSYRLKCEFHLPRLDGSKRVKYLVKNGIPKWAAGLLILALILGGGYVAYSQITTAQRREQRRQVQTATVEQVDLPVTVSANGVVTPAQLINVSPKNSGLLKSLLVKEGDRVQKGQILAYMDESDLLGQQTQAKGRLQMPRRIWTRRSLETDRRI